MQSKNLENWKIFLLLDISIFVEVWRPPEVKNQEGSSDSSASKSFGSCKNVKYFVLVFQKALLAESSTKITGGRKTLKNKFLRKFLQGSTFTTAKNSRFLELRDFKLFKQIVLIDLLLGPFYFFGSSIW